MNSIQELTEKYKGEYSEEYPKSVNSPIGKYMCQPKSGVIEVDGTKISITLNEVSGGMPVTEPFRITLHLDKVYETELVIYPKDFWNNFLDFIIPKRKGFIPKSIRKQFWFGGNKDLLKQLVSDMTFTEKIINERIYIATGDKPINQIVLTPQYGIKDMEQFEKFVYILKQIENKIKKAHKTKF